MKLGTVVKIKTITGLSTPQLIENPELQKYYGFEDMKKIEGIIVGLNTEKIIDWQEPTNDTWENPRDCGSTIMRHNCRVLWTNGNYNCFNFNNLEEI